MQMQNTRTHTCPGVSRPCLGWGSQQFGVILTPRGVNAFCTEQREGQTPRAPWEEPGESGGQVKGGGA